VAYVSSDFNAEVTSDSSRLTCQRIGGAEHLSACDDSFLSFPNHAADRSTHHVITELREEWLLNKVTVMCIKKFLRGLLSLHGDKLVAFGFETRDDVSNNSTLDTIGFDHNVCALGGIHLKGAS